MSTNQSIEEIVEYGNAVSMFKAGRRIANRGEKGYFKEMFKGQLSGEHFLIDYLRSIKDTSILLIDGHGGIIRMARQEYDTEKKEYLKEPKYIVHCQLPNDYSGNKSQFVGEVHNILSQYLANSK